MKATTLDEWHSRKLRRALVWAIGVILFQVAALTFVGYRHATECHPVIVVPRHALMSVGYVRPWSAYPNPIPARRMWRV